MFRNAGLRFEMRGLGLPSWPARDSRVARAMQGKQDEVFSDSFLPEQSDPSRQAPKVRLHVPLQISFRITVSKYLQHYRFIVSTK